MAREKNPESKSRPSPDPRATERVEVPDDVKYGAAVEEIERILASIDRDEIDLDELGQKVERAVDLLKICRAKLKATEARVTEVLKDLAAEEETDAEADADADSDDAIEPAPGSDADAEDGSSPKSRGRRRKDDEELPF
jgi:exodeoxyribonuclease VII small subunit